MVDAVVDRQKTRAVAEAYLRFLFTEPAQEIIARNHYRPMNAAVAARYANLLPPIRLFPITAVAPDWEAAQGRFFADGGVFDRIYHPNGE